MRSRKIANVGLLMIWILSLGVFRAANVGAQGSASGNTSTVLVFDTSGSMNDMDASGVVKLEAAKRAGKNLLRMIASENQAGLNTVNQVGIVEFYDSASVTMYPTTDIEASINALDSLYATGGTSMPKGLRAALDLFPTSPTDLSLIILLSDGLPNIGLNDEQDDAIVREQVLAQAAEAGRRGICLYTIGLGDPAAGTIDEAFLDQVARNSGCGKYYNARNAGELAGIYLKLRHVATGNVLLEKTGSISQGELLNIQDVQVPDNQSMMLFTLNWPGSQLEAVLRDPNGVTVDYRSYPGIYVTTTETLISIIIQNPRAGLWNFSARGVDVPEGTTIYNAILSVRPNPNSPTPIVPTPLPIAPPSSGGGGSFAIVLVVLAAGGVVVYVMTQAQKRTQRRAVIVPGTSATLFGLSGAFAGRSIPVTDGFLIGRSSGCQLRLFEDIVSRQHARLRYSNGHWYIQDLNSQSGVFINGMRVQATALNRGDRIRIGSTEFEFR